MKIEKVIFDLGKVLVKFNPRNPFKNIFKSEDDINFFKNICTWEWHINQDIVYDTRPATEKKKRVSRISRSHQCILWSISRNDSWCLRTKFKQH